MSNKPGSAILRVVDKIYEKYNYRMKGVHFDSTRNHISQYWNDSIIYLRPRLLTSIEHSKVAVRPVEENNMKVQPESRLTTGLTATDIMSPLHPFQQKKTLEFFLHRYIAYRPLPVSISPPPSQPNEL